MNKKRRKQNGQSGDLWGSLWKIMGVGAQRCPGHTEGGQGRLSACCTGARTQARLQWGGGGRGSTTPGQGGAKECSSVLLFQTGLERGLF